MSMTASGLAALFCQAAASRTQAASATTVAVDLLLAMPMNRKSTVGRMTVVRRASTYRDAPAHPAVSFMSRRHIPWRSRAREFGPLCIETPQATSDGGHACGRTAGSRASEGFCYVPDGRPRGGARSGAQRLPRTEAEVVALGGGFKQTDARTARLRAHGGEFQVGHTNPRKECAEPKTECDRSRRTERRC